MHCEKVGFRSLSECLVWSKQNVLLTLIGHEANLRRTITIYVNNSVIRLVVQFC